MSSTPKPVICITNFVDEICSRAIRYEHLGTCGRDVYHWEPGRNTHETTGTKCHAFLPTQAEQGMLCPGCYG